MIYFLFFICVCSFYFEEEIREYSSKTLDFIKFIHDNNPLLLSYYEDEKEEEEQKNEEDKQEEQEQEQEQKIELYENKYLDRYKKFTSEYSLNENDLEYKNKSFNLFVKEHYNKIEYLKNQIPIEEKEMDRLSLELNQILEKYKNGEMEKIDWEMSGCDDDEDDTTFEEEVYNDYDELCKIKKEIFTRKTRLSEFKSKFRELIAKTIEQVERDAEEKSYTNMIENKLNGFINNYIIETTPVGNVIMRYNNDKKSFEYFSNHSVPYRYLETIGRKYILTYKCKDIFIDMDEEVEKANKLNEMKKNDKSDKSIENKKLLIKPINSASILKNKNVEPPPNRTSQTIVNPINNIEMAVKNANRYTWEGRFNDFKIIKCEKKFNSNNISFSEFKTKYGKKS